MNGDVAAQVVHEIAAVNNTPPSDLDIVVGEHVDLDAIDQLVTRSDGLNELRFRIPGHEVVITGPESVSVELVQTKTTT